MIKLSAGIRRGLMLLPLLVLIGSSAAWAEGRLRGTVIDRGGDPIEGVQIKLIPKNEELPTIEAKSNKKGRFVFGLLRPSDYVLVAFKEGMRIARVDARISIPDDDRLWEFNEDMAPGTEMPAFNVTGVTDVSFDLRMEPASGEPGKYGTGLPVSPTKAIIEAMQEGRIDDALADVDRNLESQPDSSTLHYLRAFALNAAGRADEALTAIDRCLELDDDFEGGYLLKAKILSDQGRKDDALELYARELEIAESDQVRRDAYLDIANIHIGAERFEDAIAALEALLEFEPDNAGALKELAGLYIRTGDREKAAELMTQVQELGEQDPNILYNLGADRFNAGDFEGAAEYFTQTIAADPEFLDAYLQLAFTRLSLDDREAAAQNLEKFLELSPEDNPNVQTARAILQQLGKQ